MSEGTSPEPTDDFDARLKNAREGRRPSEAETDGPTTSAQGIGTALRLGTELVAALAVGVGIGHALDIWLETGPWMMIVFFFLGSGAGALNVYRVASGIGLSPGYRRPTVKGNEDEDADGGKPGNGSSV
ncbi:MAG: AtpZ/AtpI family protein [Rhodospirillales bacterium]|nr:AtpZ/AtpI family protein [Rhodospirillales bacterium]